MIQMKTLLPFILALTAPIVAAEEAVSMAAGITPGSVLYGLDRALERISLFLSFDNVARAEKHLKIASERLAELQATVDRGRTEYIEDLTTEYAGNIEAAEGIALSTGVSEEESQRMSSVLSLERSWHSFVLEDLEERVSGESLKKDIGKALKASRMGSGKHVDGSQAGNGSVRGGLERVAERAEEEKKKAEERSEEALDSLSDKVTEKALEKIWNKTKS